MFAPTKAEEESCLKKCVEYLGDKQKEACVRLVRKDEAERSVNEDVIWKAHQLRVGPHDFYTGKINGFSIVRCLVFPAVISDYILPMTSSTHIPEFPLLGICLLRLEENPVLKYKENPDIDFTVPLVISLLETRGGIQGSRVRFGSFNSIPLRLNHFSRIQISGKYLVI